MITGAMACGLAVCCAMLAIRGPSAVEARLARLTAARTELSRLRALRDDPLATKIAGAMAATVCATAISVQLSLGVMLIPIAAYVGSVGPTIVRERRDRRRQDAAQRAVITLVEWLHALVSTGRPLETAVDTMAQRGAGDDLLDSTLARVRRDYTLGVPLHRALESGGRAARISGLLDLAQRVERAREMGRGVLPALQDLRDDLRAGERARCIQAASHVDGQLTVVLTLCYLPALALVVIVPLFLTLLAGLFG